jgi:hypothetical protein
VGAESQGVKEKRRDECMPFTVDDFHDLLHILEERPEWRAELRRAILTDELLALPTQIAELRAETERRFQELAKAQGHTEKQVAALTTRVEELTEAQKRTETRIEELAEAQVRTEKQVAELVMQVTKLTRDVEVLVVDVGVLKGINLEADYRTKGHAYFSRIIRRPHVLSGDEIASLVEDAQDKGVLSDAEARELYEADVIARGKRREDGTDVYLVVEVSWGVGPHDVERAIRRAALLARLGTSVFPIVAGKSLTAEAIRLARTQQVCQVTDGYAIPPESAAE